MGWGVAHPALQCLGARDGRLLFQLRRHHGMASDQLGGNSATSTGRLDSQLRCRRGVLAEMFDRAVESVHGASLHAACRRSRTTRIRA